MNKTYAQINITAPLDGASHLEMTYRMIQIYLAVVLIFALKTILVKLHQVNAFQLSNLSSFKTDKC